MAKEGKIPSYVVGRSGIRFDIEEIKAALRRRSPFTGCSDDQALVPVANKRGEEKERE